jgi:DNA-binding IclR family transcriptional regulator
MDLDEKIVKNSEGSTPLEVNQVDRNYAYYLKTVDNALSVLELFEGENLQMGISEISKLVGLHKSIVFRILYTLKKLGYIEQSKKNKKYRPTFRSFEIGARVVNQLGFGSLIQPIMEQLALQVGETVNLGALTGYEIVYLNKVVPRSALRIDALVGARLPAQCTALGKAILAFLPKDELDDFLKNSKLKKYTPMSKTEPESLRSELDEIRRVGYSFSNEELFDGIVCLGTPILDRRNFAYAGLSIAMLKARTNLPERKEEMIRLLTHAAAEISSLTQNASVFRAF